MLSAASLQLEADAGAAAHFSMIYYWRISQFTAPIGLASSDRTYPGGLPRFDRTSNQSPAEFTTLIRVPPLICEITGEADDGLSYTDVGRVVS